MGILRNITVTSALLAVLFVASAARADRTLTILNDWTRMSVDVTVSGHYHWSNGFQGATGARLDISEYGSIPGPGGDFYAATAIAQAGWAGDAWLNWHDFTSHGLFGVDALADDFGPETAAQAEVEAAWVFRVGDEPVESFMTMYGDQPEIALRNVLLYDMTTQQVVLEADQQLVPSKSQVLEASHTYLVATHLRYGAGDGDGASWFGFGADAELLYDPDRTHVPVPAPSATTLGALGLLCLTLLRRRAVQRLS